MLRSLLAHTKTIPIESLPPARAWAIAAGANMAALRDDCLDTLATGKSAQEMRTMLDDWWDIHDAKSLTETLDWLEREGHSARFRQARALVGDVSEQDFKSILSQVSDKARVQLQLARRNLLAPQQALRGWDLARSINITRAAFDAGYIDEAYAWHEITGAAQILQMTFHSWRELSDNYLLGREFWGGGAGTAKYLEQKARWLLENSASPWKKLDWNLSLR